MSKFSDFLGTSLSKFQIAIAGVILKNSSGNLIVRNSGDSADAQLTASTVNVSGDSLILNSDAANTGTDRSITLARPTSGMSASYTLTLPTTAGSSSQVLSTDGSGNTSWVSAGSTTQCMTTDTTSLAFGDTSPKTMFTLPANAVVEAVRVIIDTAFNGSPSLSVGISGTTSKYLTTSQVDLTATAQTVFEAFPGRASTGSTEAIIATYSQGGASAGSARIEVDYVIPA